VFEETWQNGESISEVARRNGAAPNLRYRWRRLMSEGVAVAVQTDDAVTGNGDVRRLEERIWELERQLGSKTLDVEILEVALAKARFQVKAVAQTLGVSGSNLVEQLAKTSKPRRRYDKAQDAAVLEEVRKLVRQRPT
jgi:transposase-like protein